MGKIVNLTLAGMLALYAQGCTHKELKAPEKKYGEGSILALLGFGTCVDLTDYLKRQGIKDLDIPYNDEVELRINRGVSIGGTNIITGISIAGQPPNERLTEICFNPEYNGDLDAIIYYIMTGDESKIPKTQ